jgi:hypothetical protein
VRSVPHLGRERDGAEDDRDPDDSSRVATREERAQNEDIEGNREVDGCDGGRETEAPLRAADTPSPGVGSAVTTRRVRAGGPRTGWVLQGSRSSGRGPPETARSG